MKHIHECPECTEDFECEDESCVDDVDGVYVLEKTCKGCREEE